MARKPQVRAREAHWDIDRLIARFGGIEPMIRAHGKLGTAPLSYGKVHQWQRRGRIPAEPLAEILLALKKLIGPKKRCDLWEFIVTTG